ncbi:MAG TPA: hypothetical protein GXZ82_01890 [Firmicutes bacterium]|jgi:tRNA uridine 5-carbamoylmethylation protein Kti12|nr:hypothetical protein [Bacillota bacterium]
MTPQDIIWRVTEHLEETKSIVASGVEECHPVRHQDLISTLHEVERLIQTQIHLMNRVKRRYP